MLLGTGRPKKSTKTPPSAAGDGEAEEVDEDAAVADAGVLVDEGADAAALTEGFEGGAHGAVGEDDLKSRGPLAAAGVEKAVEVGIAHGFGDGDHVDAGVEGGHDAGGLPASQVGVDEDDAFSGGDVGLEAVRDVVRQMVAPSDPGGIAADPEELQKVPAHVEEAFPHEVSAGGVVLFGEGGLEVLEDDVPGGGEDPDAGARGAGHGFQGAPGEDADEGEQAEDEQELDPVADVKEKVFHVDWVSGRIIYRAGGRNASFRHSPVTVETMAVSWGRSCFLRLTTPGMKKIPEESAS